MVYDGTADPVCSSDDTAGWYTALRKTHGDDTAKFARYRGGNSESAASFACE